MDRGTPKQGRGGRGRSSGRGKNTPRGGNRGTPKGTPKKASKAGGTPGGTPANGLSTPKGKGPHHGTPQSGRTPSSSKKRVFEAHLSAEEADKGIAEGRYYEGTLRQNPQHKHHAYITIKKFDRDVLVDGFQNRNRSFHGDLVVIEVFPQSEWKNLNAEASDSSSGSNITIDGSDDGVVGQENEEAVRPSADVQVQTGHYQPTGRVVFIREVRHVNCFVGRVVPNTRGPRDLVQFIPQDVRAPFIMAKMSSLGEHLPAFLENPDSFKKVVFTARIDRWGDFNRVPIGTIMERLGERGLLTVETRALLLKHGIVTDDFSEKVYNWLESRFGDRWVIPDDEIAKRRDLRSKRIFSIDPPTARDLDDALHIEPLDDGNFTVGVHIADVTYFMPKDGQLDMEARVRGTSTYLVDQVIPMLPRLLCENLCSLNPDTDRLAFSCIWTLTPEGKIIDTWFGRSVIRSCAKLSYNHAQAIIDAGSADVGAGVFDDAEVSDGHTRVDVAGDVLRLHGISRHLRASRFENGSLTLNNVKLSFRLDENLEPCEWSVYQIKESNQLVEEFMLLANQSVAKKIADVYPDRALLRRHPPPHSNKADEVAALMEKHKIPFDTTSAAGIQASLVAVRDTMGPLLYQVVQNILTKPMQVAEYFCTGDVPDNEGVEFYRHYALNFLYYTHFTSPIRRYADVIVHRVLAAALEEEGAESQLFDGAMCGGVAENLNRCKMTAKMAQQDSSLIFLCAYLKKNPLLNVEAVVAGVGPNSFHLLVLSCGVEKRIKVEDVEGRTSHYLTDDGALSLHLKGGRQILLHLFGVVRVNVIALPVEEKLDFDIQVIPEGEEGVEG